MSIRTKLFLGIMTLLLLLSSFSTPVTYAASNNPVDVPADHWAYKAVKALIDKGYLQLYQDQTFQGDKPVDRFTLATVVAKVLNEIAIGQVGTSREDVMTLRKLINEFRDELVDLTAKRGIFDAKITELAKQDAVIKEDLTKTTANLQKLSADEVQLQKEVQTMVSDLIVLKERVKRLEEENKRQNTLMWISIILGLVGLGK